MRRTLLALLCTCCVTACCCALHGIACAAFPRIAWHRVRLYSLALHRIAPHCSSHHVACISWPVTPPLVAHHACMNTHVHMHMHIHMHRWRWHNAAPHTSHPISPLPPQGTAEAVRRVCVPFPLGRASNRPCTLPSPLLDRAAILCTDGHAHRSVSYPRACTHIHTTQFSVLLRSIRRIVASYAQHYHSNLTVMTHLSFGRLSGWLVASFKPFATSHTHPHAPRSSATN